MTPAASKASKSYRDTKLLALRVWIVVGAIIIATTLLNVFGVLAPVVEFLAVGSLIAFVESPIVNQLERHGVPRGLGAFVGLLIVVATIVCLFIAFMPMLFNQTLEILSKLPPQMRTASVAIGDMLSRFKSLRSLPGGESVDSLLASATTMATKYVTQMATELGRGVFPFISAVASQLFVIFLGLVLAYWLACDYPRMHREMCCILGEEKETSYQFMIAILSRSIGGYMRGMVVTSVVGGFLAFIGFALIGHPYAGLMGTLTGFLHLIPVVGPWISAAIATVLGFIYDPFLGLWTLIVTMVAQNITDNVISPKVMQSTVQVHPAMSLTALVIGSALMGPIGMVIAIPLSAALKGLFIFYFEKDTKRQLVSYEGAIFKGTPFHDFEGDPVAAYDALGDDTFIADSELISNEVAPHAEAMPKPELDNPWLKMAGIQPPDASGIFKSPFFSDRTSNANANREVTASRVNDTSSKQNYSDPGSRDKN